MTVREAVDYLTTRGYPCSTGTVRALAKAKTLHCYRPGVTGKGPLAFTVAQLDLFLREAEFGVTEAEPTKPERKVMQSTTTGKVATSNWRERLKQVLGT
jgi:hypothetical protein